MDTITRGNIETVKKLIASGKAVIFVGSGVSAYSTEGSEFASWVGLLKNGIERLLAKQWVGESFKQKADETLNNSPGIDELLKIATKITEELNECGKDEFATWLIETVGSLTPKKTDLIESLGQLNVPILTTNYDPLLSSVLKKDPVTFDRIKRRGWESVSDMLDKCIFHVHGYYSEPDSVIFDESSYTRITKPGGLAQVILSSLLVDKTVIYVGYGAGLEDPNFVSLFKWMQDEAQNAAKTCYKIELQQDQQQRPGREINNLQSIVYGNKYEDLVPFIKRLAPQYESEQRFRVVSHADIEDIKKNYLNSLINNYSSVFISGFTDIEMKLPLDDVFVELKLDTTHPSVRAGRIQKLVREFNRKLFGGGLFSYEEQRKIDSAIAKRNPLDYLRRDLDERYIESLLRDEIFTDENRTSIKNQIKELRQRVFSKKEDENELQMGIYPVNLMYAEFRHLIILGHPGSGKTTLSKWITINMAREGLGIENRLFTAEYKRKFRERIPCFIPIWKYIEHLKQNSKEQKKGLLEFITEHASGRHLNQHDPVRVDGADLIIKKALREGNALIILEGLDEIPFFEERAFLMAQINMLLEKRIFYNPVSNELLFSDESKEVQINENPDIGNRVIITSRIEGNYFSEINSLVPRLTVNELSSTALEKFCFAYMQAIGEYEAKQKGTWNGNEPAIKAFSHEQAKKLYAAITGNNEIQQLAINPQLASVIASVFDPLEGLPSKRTKLYETALNKIIKKILDLSPDIRDKYLLNEEEIWSIMQTIAMRMHSKTESLKEEEIRSTISNCLAVIRNEDATSPSLETRQSVSKLLSLFKINAGIITEFGVNSFRFIHRTFQEYLAARYLAQSRYDIFIEEITEKIAIPNWRVPLHMALGLLSTNMAEQFPQIISHLLSSNESDETISVAHFVIIDSLQDIDFDSIDETTRYEIFELLVDELFKDYKNLSGFSKLKNHQKLIESYFTKIKSFTIRNADQSGFLKDWILRKIVIPENVAPVANLLIQAKWYEDEFYDHLLLNLHNDDGAWNWSVDRALRFYCAQNPSESEKRIKLKRELKSNPEFVDLILSQSDWLRLITALYGGYADYNTPQTLREYSEIESFLSMDEALQSFFIPVYKEKWGEDVVYNMAVYLNNFEPKKHWAEIPSFDINHIYKDSFLSGKIYELLAENRPALELKTHLNALLKSSVKSYTKAEAIIALMALGDLTGVIANIAMQPEVANHLKNRTGQLLSALKDPVARFASRLPTFFTDTLKQSNAGDLYLGIPLLSYFKVFLSLLMQAGGKPQSMMELFNNARYSDETNYSLGEYLATIFTGSSEDSVYNVAVVCDTLISRLSSEHIIGALEMVGHAIQAYRPVRNEIWPVDTFTFKREHNTDIPVAVISNLENIPSAIGFARESLINDVSDKTGLLHEFPDLKMPLLLMNAVTRGEHSNNSKINELLAPGISQRSDIKDFFLGEIDNMPSGYIKALCYCQLAEFHHSKSSTLLEKALKGTNDIAEAVLKFQVLEKIVLTGNFLKAPAHLVNTAISDTFITAEEIVNPYNRAIALIRAAFHANAETRTGVLQKAGKSVEKIPDVNEQAQLLKKIKMLAAVYPELENEVGLIIENTKNDFYKLYINGNYGQLLVNKDFSNDNSITKHLSQEHEIKNSNQEELRSLNILFASTAELDRQFNENDDPDTLWVQLLKYPSEKNAAKLLEAGARDGFLLTPVITLVIDEMYEQGRVREIEQVFPYIFKPSPELMPVVQRWYKLKIGRLKQLAAILICESKYITHNTLDTIVDLLADHSDQMRYRAILTLQHRVRDVNEPEKRISLLGKETITRILEKIHSNKTDARISAPLKYLFFDLLWDDPSIFGQLLENPIHQLNRINFIDDHSWNALLNLLRSKTVADGKYAELVDSVMKIGIHKGFAGLPELTQLIPEACLESLSSRLYIKYDVLSLIRYIVEISGEFELQQGDNESTVRNMEDRIILETSISLKKILTEHPAIAGDISSFNHTVPKNYNVEIISLLNQIPVREESFRILLHWLLKRLKTYNVNLDPFQQLLTESLLCLVSGLSQKEDYLYRQITSSWNKPQQNQFQELLSDILDKHPYFPARGAAFILLSSMEIPDHVKVMDAMDTLLDENLVSQYSVLAIPFIRLDPNAYVGDLLKVVQDESAVKVYYTLKIITQFALAGEKIDINSKSKIIRALTDGISNPGSKKQVSLYYTERKLPVAVTLEEAFYNVWLNIQGLAGKIIN